MPEGRAVDDQLWVECGRCHRTVVAAVLGKVYEEEDDGPWGVETVLMKCPACGSPIVATQRHEATRPPDYFWEASGPAVLVYPSPARRLSWATPAAISDAFDEAQRCYRINAYRGAAILARLVLEGIAAELGQQEGNLAGRLRRLAESGDMDAQLVRWAVALKDVGNEAAHELGAPVTRQDAEDVLSFAEALADYVFTFRKRFEEFERRRSGVSPPTPTPLLPGPVPAPAGS
jgi:hypothetical protein